MLVRGWTVGNDDDDELEAFKLMQNYFCFAFSSHRVAKGKRRLEKNGSMKRMYQLVEQPRQKVRNMINYIEHKGNIMTGKVEAPNDGRPRPHGRRTAGSRDSLHAGAILVETGNGGGGGGRTNNTATPTTDGGRCSSSASTESSTIASSEGTHGTTV